MGGNTARGLVMAVAGALGSSASLAVKAPGLPGYVQASQLLDMESGGQLQLSSLGNVRAVSVGSGAVSVVVAPPAVAMASPPSAGSQPVAPPPPGPRKFKSFDSFKTAMGPAGPGQEWHHIVEQNPTNIEQFGAEALQNEDNIIRLDKQLHQRVSGFYSTKDDMYTGTRTLTIRQWLSQQPFEYQRSFGLRAIDKIQNGLMP